MGQATAGLIGAALGATTVLVSSYLAFRYQIRLEEKKSKIARDDALLKELRTYIAEVQREMFSALHSMGWIAWHGWKGFAQKVRSSMQEAISEPGAVATGSRR